MKKIIALALISLVLVGSLVASTIVIKGSNTVYPIAQLWAEDFKAMNPEVEISIEGAGSSTGYKALLEGQADIADASRWIKSKEVVAMNEAGKLFVPFIVAYDGIAVIVNPELGIENITIEQLGEIYSGKLGSWKNLDDSLDNKRIVVYSRDNASGTYEYFTETVLGDERLAPQVQMLPSTNAIVEQVSQNKYAIGYIGMGYLTDTVTGLAVEGVLPTVANVNSGTYPISRPLFMWVDGTNGLPEGKVMDFIKYALTPEGQARTLDAGYVNAYGIE
ncbi:MAG: phosphate transport system substrate-binding protein [Kosmotogales bacterium]|nr:phosphate transport system substrate-binding protein [Kosmotogales bacterium]